MNLKRSRALFRQFAYEEKLFLMLDLINQEEPFNDEELLELMYILMNHAMCDDLDKIFDITTIKDNLFNILDIIQEYKDSYSWKFIKYTTIRYDYFITIIIKILYNFAGIQTHTKIIFLTLLNEFIEYSNVNSIVCGQVHFYLANISYNMYN